MSVRSICTAIALCALLCLSGCREGSQPTAHDFQSTPGADASAESPEPATEPGVDWPLPIEEPSWYRALATTQRSAVHQADELVAEALARWRGGEVQGVRNRLTEAERMYSETVGDSHWKQWSCRAQQALRDAERGLSEGDRQWFAEEGLESFIHDDFSTFVYRAAIESSRTPEQVNAACERLRRLMGDQYEGLVDAYREWHHAQSALGARDLAAGHEHARRAVKHIEDAVPAAHPLNAAMHTFMSQLLIGQRLSTAQQEELQGHLRAALHTLHEHVPADHSSAEQWYLALHVAGQWMRMHDRLGEAKWLYSAAAGVCERFLTYRPAWLAICLLDLAEASNAVGAGYEALALLRQIETQQPEALEPKDRWTRFQVERGFAKLRLGAYEEACNDLQRALEAGSYPPGRKRERVHYFYGAALTKRRLFTDAIAQYEAAAEIVPEARTSSLATLFKLRAAVFNVANRGETEGLRPLAAELAAIGGDIGAAGEARRYRLLAYAYLLLDEREEALSALENAVVFYEAARVSAGLAPLDLGPWHENESPYLLGAICALRLGDHQKAFEWLERHSGQVLVSITQAIRARATTWPDVLKVLGSADGPRPANEPPAEGAAASAPTLPPAAWPGKLAAGLRLDRGSAVVGWVEDVPEAGRPALPDRWVFALYSAGDKAELSFVRLSDCELRPQDVIRAFRGDPGAARWKECSYSFSKQRFVPIMPYLAGAERLYVLSRGEMLGFPVDALLLENPAEHVRPQLVGERFAVANGPSFSVLEQLTRRAEKGRGKRYRALIIGDATSSQRALPACAAEIDSVAGYFGSHARVLRGAEAREGALYSLSADAPSRPALTGYSHIHFAVHGEADLLSPDQAHLELSAEHPPQGPGTLPLGMMRRIDGLLSFGEILSLKLGSPLVVLSACESGVGRPLESEGYLGLPHAFFAAGARALVITLWPVDDVAAALLMDRFYSNLLNRRMSESESLQEAKEYLRQRQWSQVVAWCDQHGAGQLVKGALATPDLAYSHPKYWAPFVLIGPPERTEDDE